MVGLFFFFKGPGVTPWRERITFSGSEATLVFCSGGKSEPLEPTKVEKRARLLWRTFRLKEALSLREAPVGVGGILSIRSWW